MRTKQSRVFEKMMLGVVFFVILTGQASAAKPITTTITYEANCSSPAGSLAICDGTAFTPFGNFPFFIELTVMHCAPGPETLCESWAISDPVTGFNLMSGGGKATFKAGVYSADGYVRARPGSVFSFLDGQRDHDSGVLTGPWGTLSGKLSIRP